MAEQCHFSTLLEVHVPALFPADGVTSISPLDITVEIGGTEWNTSGLSLNLHDHSPPEVVRIYPVRGPLEGDTIITVFGAGFQDSDEGKVYLNNKNITRSQSYAIARLGMIRTFQLTKVFDRMTVLENMMFSASTVNNDSFLKSIAKLPSQKTTEKKIRNKSFEIMKELNIDHMANSYAREMSGGQKKLLELKIKMLRLRMLLSKWKLNKEMLPLGTELIMMKVRKLKQVALRKWMMGNHHFLTQKRF